MFVAVLCIKICIMQVSEEKKYKFFLNKQNFSII